MGNLVNYVTSLHQATSRKYIDRMVDDKVHCMLKAFYLFFHDDPVVVIVKLKLYSIQTYCYY